MIPLVKVVPLTPEQEAEMQRLEKKRQCLQAALYQAEAKATEAIQKKNLLKKQLDCITGQWLKLAEIKFPD